jgi:hypothetical protein
MGIKTLILRRAGGPSRRMLGKTGKPVPALVALQTRPQGEVIELDFAMLAG